MRQERANISTESRLLAMQMFSSRVGYREAMERFEAAYIQAAVQVCGGNQCRAADALGIHRNTIARIIRRSKKWVEVWRLSTGRVWPRIPLDHDGQVLCDLSDFSDNQGEESPAEKRRA